MMLLVLSISAILQVSHSVSFCLLPIVPGPCTQYVIRYAFQPSISACRRFTFGGCEGNDNNFMTRRDCEHYCEELL
uniref:Kunitz-type serine protease inhibitor As-fr-19 n=1 Tax=Anoplius samariensis TaxID=200614 RepID=VKT19_ANOSM|nr:RecName: Full=Kunitz-type serine protease inhibitor As-fr-19; Short=Asfr19; Flags: Precursor [Anoplius samariensis]BAD93276.1 peptide toxin As-fr-19 [Anoplius samariensis]